MYMTSINERMYVHTEVAVVVGWLGEERGVHRQVGGVRSSLDERKGGEPVRGGVQHGLQVAILEAERGEHVLLAHLIYI